MICKTCIVTILLAVAASAPTAGARERHHQARLDANGNLDVLISRYAAANNVPESLVRRVIRRESRGNPRAVHNGNYGLMQIRLGTARAMGYRGGARGLLRAETNMTYAVKYLAGGIEPPAAMPTAPCTTTLPVIITPQSAKACSIATR